MKNIIIANGIFSTLTISLNDNINDKLVFIKPEDNPLKSVEGKLNDVLAEFERTYFYAVDKSSQSEPEELSDERE